MLNSWILILIQFCSAFIFAKFIFFYLKKTLNSTPLKTVWGWSFAIPHFMMRLNKFHGLGPIRSDIQMISFSVKFSEKSNTWGRVVLKV